MLLQARLLKNIPTHINCCCALQRLVLMSDKDSVFHMKHKLLILLEQCVILKLGEEKCWDPMSELRPAARHDSYAAVG